MNNLNIYISSSWKNRDQVRSLAIRLRIEGYDVYDFTDPKCRKVEEIPPEKFPEEFNPNKHRYSIYLNRPEWKAAVNENKKALHACDLVLLLLPCGIDATADWAYALGLGKKSVIIGCPKKGERSPVYLWANVIVKDIDYAIDWIKIYGEVI